MTVWSSHERIAKHRAFTRNAIDIRSLDERMAIISRRPEHRLVFGPATDIVYSLKLL